MLRSTRNIDVITILISTSAAVCVSHISTADLSDSVQSYVVADTFL